MWGISWGTPQNHSGWTGNMARARGLNRLTALEIKAAQSAGWYGDGGGLLSTITHIDGVPATFPDGPGV